MQFGQCISRIGNGYLYTPEMNIKEDVKAEIYIVISRCKS
jgi:hypothetical protein